MRETKKRKLYAKIENLGNLSLLVGGTSMGISLLTANQAVLVSSSLLALSGLTASIVGNHLRFKENINDIDYLKRLDEENNKKTKKLTLKKYLSSGKI